MKKNKFVLIGLGLLAVLVLAACGSQAPVNDAVSPPAEEQKSPVVAQVTTAPDVQPSESAPTVENTSPAVEVDMEAFIKSKVAGNHDLDRIFNAAKTREEWNATLDRMIGYGAKMTEAEKQQIIEYLLSR